MSTTTLPPPRLYNPQKDKQLLHKLAEIQAACITNDNQLATFLPPLDPIRMTDFWYEISSDVDKRRTAVVLQFADEEETEVAGYVCLMMPITETGPFRGQVRLLMVSGSNA